MDKARLFEAAKRRTNVVGVNGVQVSIRALSLAQRIALIDRIKEDEAEALVWVICQGVEGLGEEDAAAVRDMDPVAIQTLSEAILRLSGLGEEVGAKNG